MHRNRAGHAATFICCLGLLAPTATAATFRVLYNGSYGDGGSPFGIVQFTPNTFFWSALTGILTINKKGEFVLVTQLTRNLPVTAANGWEYSGAYNASTNFIISFLANPDSVVTYPAQAFGIILSANLSDGGLLGFGNGSNYQNNLLKVDLQGNVTSVYTFPINEFSETFPFEGSDGNYYGVSLAQFQGTSYVYRITPSGSLTKLANLPLDSFDNNGDVASLVEGSDGNFYGDTVTGGNSYGTIYQVTPSGQYTVLYTFPEKGIDSFPGTIFQASDGNIYGVTNGSFFIGAIFMLTPSLQYTHLLNLSGCPCTLIQGSDGNLYGTEYDGGIDGRIFELELGLPIPAPQAITFQPTSGAVGTHVMIWGKNLLEASVRFNGVSAREVQNSGPNYIWATVPAGATSGPITVTTAGGTSTTHSSFVIQ